jgi:hypothetical protein
VISTADPLNLSGILLPGARIHPLAGGAVRLLGPATESDSAGREPAPLEIVVPAVSL